jgi:hypothetical protein
MTATQAIEAGAAAVSAGSAIYQLANMPKANLPPSPTTGLNDQQIQASEQAALKRREAAAGLQGTTGTPGGEAGAVLNPATLSNKSVLGG